MFSFPDRPSRGSPPQASLPSGDDANDHMLFGRSATAVVVLLPLRLFLAAGWTRAGAEKLISPEWWSGNELLRFLAAQREEALPFFRPVMENVIAPAAALVAIVVMVTQLVCGIAIALGKRLRLALRWCFLLNVTFILAGRVTPSAFYLVMQAVLLFAVADGTLGVHATKPSSRTVVAAGVSAGLVALVVPYVRTIEPANVIEDPAMMLAFMGSVITATLLVRRAAYLPHESSRLHVLWKTHMIGWVHAMPRHAVAVAPEFPTERRTQPDRRQHDHHRVPDRRRTTVDRRGSSVPAIGDQGTSRRERLVARRPIVD
jgi:uncharacterized membrane protein YphA (DoxX/SURF4 family)